MIGFCPSCGHNLVRDEPIIRGDWLLRTNEVFFKGLRQKLTPLESEFLHTLAKAAPFAVRRDTLGMRISESSNPSNYVSVVAAHIRKKLTDPPFECVWGSGFRWTGDAAEPALPLD